MTLKFTKEEMALLNAICDIEVSADGTKTYSMKPMVVDDEGCTDIEAVDAFKLMTENKFLSDPSIDFKFKEPATKIIDEEEFQSINETFLFDKMVKNVVKVGMELHLFGINYDVCGIDYVNKKITLRRGDNQLFDYFELKNQELDFVRKLLKEKSDEAIKNNRQVRGFLGVDVSEFSKEELIMLLNVVKNEGYRQ